MARSLLNESEQNVRPDMTSNAIIAGLSKDSDSNYKSQHIQEGKRRESSLESRNSFDLLDECIKSSNTNIIDCGHDDFPFCDCLQESLTNECDYVSTREPELFNESIKIDSGSFSSDKISESVIQKSFPIIGPQQQLPIVSNSIPIDIIDRFHSVNHKLEVSDYRSSRRKVQDLGASLSSLRSNGLKSFDEAEESNVLEPESEEDEEEEGAVGAMSSPNIGCLLSRSPGGIRRASIVICDSRKPSLVTEPQPIKIAAFGNDGVGKSALIVRLLTGRFIGEYDPSMEALYSYQIPLIGYNLPLQVMDTAGNVEVAEDGREAQVSWGEGFLLVFSLTSHKTFMGLHHIRRVILELTPGSPRPMVLVGNKADLTHAREVTPQEIKDLAELWGSDYFEVSAAEPWDVVIRPFTALYHAVLENRHQFNFSIE